MMHVNKGTLGKAKGRKATGPRIGRTTELPKGVLRNEL
jgi:hypothetical protein